MRQIKFRGKRIDNGQWAYGFYHNCVGNANFVVHNYDLSYSTEQKELNVHWILQCSLPDSIGWDIKDSFTAYKIDPKTVGQFTGLLDNNGKEIWEGDVFGTETAQYGVEPIGKVVFDIDFCAFVIQYFNGGWRYLWEHMNDKISSKKITGNIHETL